MGDAAGIGPEVIGKALGESHIYDICRPLVIGDGTVIQNTIDLLGSQLSIHAVVDTSGLKGEHGIIDILDLHNLDGEIVMENRKVKTVDEREVMKKAEDAAFNLLER